MVNDPIHGGGNGDPKPQDDDGKQDSGSPQDDSGQGEGTSGTEADPAA